MWRGSDLHHRRCGRSSRRAAQHTRISQTDCLKGITPRHQFDCRRLCVVSPRANARASARGKGWSWAGREGKRDALLVLQAPAPLDVRFTGQRRDIGNDSGLGSARSFGATVYVRSRVLICFRDWDARLHPPFHRASLCLFSHSVLPSGQFS